MSTTDAKSLADLAVRLKLVSPNQMATVWDEVGKGAEAEVLLRGLERKGFLTPFQTNKLLKGETEGYFLGGYRLLYKISSGSFGRVFRADDPQTGRVFALKVLRRKKSEKSIIDLFEREGKMGMTLRHPNIVEILAVSYDRASDQHYMVMEFVEGGNLRDIQQIRKKLNVTETLRVLEETAQGLDYAFSRGITHRDLKLTNVLLSSQGTAKLVDFGLASGKLGFDSKDDPGVSRTIEYAGLEEATGAPRDDSRSDMFFLGCIAYEMLTGRAPYERRISKPQGRMDPNAFLKIQPLKPEEIDGSPMIIRLVEGLMALKPSERIQNPAQLLIRIKELRAEIEGGGKFTAAGPGSGSTKQPTIFVAERDESLQDVLRTKLKEHGFRVLIAGDPVRALDRYRQNPFEMLIVDAITTGENGFVVFEQILKDAARQHHDCRGILMLGPDQTGWKAKLGNMPHVAFLSHPVKYKQLLTAIQSLMPSMFQ